MILNESECEAMDIDPKAVEKLARRFEKLAKDAGQYGITIFCGSGSSLRFYDTTGPVILAHLDSPNLDGGAGDAMPGADGLMRGEV